MKIYNETPRQVFYDIRSNYSTSAREQEREFDVILKMFLGDGSFTEQTYLDRGIVRVIFQNKTCADRFVNQFSHSATKQPPTP